MELGEILRGPTTLPIVPISFGDADLATTPILEHPPNGNRDPAVYHGDLRTMILRGAVVHGPAGIITLGDRVVSESLAHVPLHEYGYERTEDGVVLPAEAVVVRLAQAHYAMGGGYRNHFHWLLEIVPRLQVPPFVSPGFDGVILMPPPRNCAQRDMLGWLAEADHAVVTGALNTRVEVDTLNHVPNLAGYGFMPHPILGTFFDTLLRQMGIGETPRLRLYIARLGSPQRRMSNENEVIALVRRHGFQIVHLEGMSLAAQARLFASASHIVAGHGAGLANLLFCHPGTRVCEIHMDHYVNWCFRRVGSVRAIRYGCVIGRSAGEPNDEGYVHHLPWTAPLDQLARALDDPAFTGTGMVAAAPDRADSSVAL